MLFRSPSRTEDLDGGGVLGILVLAVAVGEGAKVAVVVREGSAELVNLHGDAASTTSSSAVPSPQRQEQKEEKEKRGRGWRR